MRRTGLVALSLLAFATPAASDERLLHWGSFKVEMANIRGSDFDVEILSDQGPGIAGTYARFIRTQRLIARGGPPHQLRAVKTWADSTTCPAIAARLSALAALQVPSLTSPFQAQSPAHLLLDGSSNEIEVPGRVDDSGAETEVRLSGNVDSAVAHWIGDTMQALRSCWRPEST